MPIAPEYLHMVFPDETFYALLYGRNSRDPKKKGRSVDDQLTNGTTLCARHTWPIVGTYRDTGISASRHSRQTRDDFEELLEAIQAGVARIVVAYEASRYYRDLEAYVRLRNACANAGVLLCYDEQVYDLSKREDRKATAMDAIAAEDEAEGIRNRNLRTAELTAEAGAPWGKIPFGYMRKYDEATGDLVGQFEHPAQGAYVMRALAHVDSGNSVYSLIRWLNSEEKAARPDGKPWDKDNAKYMLLNRSYLGERIHHGARRKATWAPLKGVRADGADIPGLDTPEGRAMFHRVTQKLTARRIGSARDTRAAHFLTFIALCGVCGDDVVLTSQKDTRSKGSAGRKYQCAVKTHTAIREDLLDAYVEEGIVTWLQNKEQARAALITDPAKAKKEIAEAQELLEVYEAELDEARTLANTRNTEGRPLLSLTSLSQKELDLLPKIERMQQKVASATGVPELIQRLLAAKDPQAAWTALSLEQRREAVRRIVTVRLNKARARGVKSIEPGRIMLSFAGQPGFRDRPLRARGAERAQAEGRG